MSSKPLLLRVLLAGQNDADASLIVSTLEGQGYRPSVTRVATTDDFRGAVASDDFDVIIARYASAEPAGLEALAAAKEFGHDVPFIMVSREAGEERAVDAMRAGAHDYVMLDNPGRLGPAIERELAEVEVRRERAAHQRLILESEARFRATFEQLAVGLVHLATDGRCLRANQRACQITRWPRSELEGRDFRVLFDPADREKTSERLQSLLEGREERCTAEQLLVRRDGSRVWAQLTANLASAPGAGEFYVVLAIEDITERRAAETALRESEARYRILLEQASDGIFISDEQGRFIDVNDHAIAMLGFTKEELRAMTIFDLIPREDLTGNPPITRNLAPGESAIVTRRVLRKNDVPLPVEISIKRMDDGRIQSIARDLTERYESRRRLELSETRFRTVAAATSDAVYDWDLQTDRVWWNENFFRLFGHSPGADVEVSSWWLAHIHEADRERVSLSLEKALVAETTISWEYRFRRADGSYAHVIDRAYILRGPEGVPTRMIGSMMDISARKMMEDALRESEERFRALVENASDIVGVLEGDGTFRYASPAIERVLGYRPDEMVGRSVFDYLHPADRDRMKSIFRQGLDQPREVRRVEHRMIHRDGSVRHIETIGRNLISHGSVGGVIVTSRDVTERKLIEAKLEQAQRLTSLGKLAASVAHEFNNVMMGIQAFAAVIRRESGSSPQMLRAATAISSSVERGRRITQEILRFTQSPDPDIRPIDVGRWLHEADAELRTAAGANSLTFQVADSLAIAGDRTQLTQVIVNLLINARDALGERHGHITITAERAAGDGNYPFGVVRHAATFAHIIVSDDGSGIPETALPHVFEPLFTTKRTGTGLGLAVVHQFVMHHGGHIFVESREGEGTTIHIFLPRADMPEPVESSAPEAVNAPLTGTATILLVEDDPLVAEGLEALLMMEGFEVVTAPTAAAARTRFERATPDLVLLDVGLPDGDGLELAKELRSRRPELKIIFSTGHGDEGRIAGAAGQNTAFLQKPYTPERLREVVGRMLATS